MPTPDVVNPLPTVPRVTVVVVSWNAKPLLERFLPSVVRSTWPSLEIVLADNGSDDGSAEWVERELPSVRVERLGSNLGYCGGNNEAVRRTTGEYVVLLNNDVAVEPGWLEPLVARAEADPTIGALQPKLLQVDPPDRFEYAGAAGGHLDRLGYPFARGRVFDTLEEDRGQHDEYREVFWASGAALFLRRSALDAVGLLDERFEFHMEEIDLCWRLRRGGWRVACEPASVARHLGGGSLAQGNPRKTAYNFRNSLLMLYKNLAPRDWWRVFPQRLVLDAAAAARFAARLEFANAWAVARAYVAAHFMKSAYTPPDRTEVRPSYGRSIAVDYFLRGRRTVGALDGEAFGPEYRTPVSR